MRVVGINWGIGLVELHWRLLSGNSRGNRYPEEDMGHTTGGSWMKTSFQACKITGVPSYRPSYTCALCDDFEASPIMGRNFDSDLDCDLLWPIEYGRSDCVPFLSLSTWCLVGFHSVFNPVLLKGYIEERWLVSIESPYHQPTFWPSSWCKQTREHSWDQSNPG